MIRNKKYNINEFDYEFYTNLYPDLKKNNIIHYNDVLQHWMTYGKSEKRVCNSKMMANNVYYFLKKSLYQINNIPILSISKKDVYILVRTHNRPNLFDICMKSILNQTIKSNILVSFDNIDNFDYIFKYNRIESYYYDIQTFHSHTYNLYFNFLMEHVKSGWIFFLDDDDLFIHPYSLQIILQHISSEDDLIIWKYLRSDKEIYPLDLNNIKKGEIASCNFCFHSKFKHLSIWKDYQCGDYYFFKELIDRYSFQIKFIPICLTGIIQKNKISNYGQDE